jgi:EAL domain-containing protein (putative c-di-GMP-specific phosphodiesterase class I)
MYAAKANGKNDLQFYEPTLNATSKERLSLEQALHKAVERNELVLHYQPQIDTRVGKVVGMEALMRWNHGGVLIPPCDFIPLAEETGLIISFGEWAIKTAVSQNRMWIDNGFDPLPIAVNIPGSHFERPNFVEIIHSALRAGNIDARYLELEITETTLMRNLSITLPRLEILTKQGLRLSVDDFGTGYSSLSYLRRLPIDTLKIDASFVRDLDKDSDSEAIVAAIIAMARSLNLRVIAEGVETYDQLCLLHAYGCHIMQGYYFARPLDSRALAQFRREYGDTKNTPQWKIPAKSRVVSLLGANVR